MQIFRSREWAEELGRTVVLRQEQHQYDGAAGDEREVYGNGEQER